MAGAHLGDIRGIDRQLTFDGNKTDKNEMITVEIDLTNPNDLMEKLEMIDLTDEETDYLIEKATELNKVLREELRKREDMDESTRSFVISAPSSSHPRKPAEREIHTPNLSSMSYHDKPVFHANSLARLQSGNVASASRSRQDTDYMKCSPYSYHSAKPIRSLGLHGASHRPGESYHKGYDRMDRY